MSATSWLMSAWGIALSLLGFGITWWQLYRTRTASQKVAEALHDIRSDYAAFDVVTELRTALAAGDDALACLEDDRWGGVMTAYDRARISLIKMASINGGLRDDKVSEAKDFAGDMLSSCGLVSEKHVSSPQEIPKPSMIANLRLMNNFLIALEQEIKGGIGGKH